MAGYHTEYSGVKFAFFLLGEYSAMIVISLPRRDALLRRLDGCPSRHVTTALRSSWAWWLLGAVWFFMKVDGVHASCTSGSARRSRASASTSSWTLGWKWMIPLALANILVAAFAILLFPGRTHGLVWLVVDRFGGDLRRDRICSRSSGRRARSVTVSRRAAVAEG